MKFRISLLPQLHALDHSGLTGQHDRAPKKEHFDIAFPLVAILIITLWVTWCVYVKKNNEELIIDSLFDRAKM